MTSRKRTYWFDDDYGPRVGWTDADVEWEQAPLDDLEEYEARLLPLNCLTEKQRFVVECMWGLRDCEQLSTPEVAALMGVSQQAVARIHGRAMKKLREEMGVVSGS